MNTENVAKVIGVSKSTLLRWISTGLIDDVKRDERGWRYWTNEDVQRVIRFKETYWGLGRSTRENDAPRWRYDYASSLSRFSSERYMRAQKNKENEINKK